MPDIRILVAPLDWGLGHAARCVPVIRALAERGACPVIASAGPALDLLRREFPELPAVRLPAYGVQYPGKDMIWDIALQLPHIGRTAWREHRLLRRIIDDYKIRGVISDNRFGCFSRRVPSVFITHQVHIRVPAAGLERLVRWANGWLLQRYDACWIPDTAEMPGLAGELSHPVSLPHCRYIGPLSRLGPGRDPVDAYDVVFLLSGPEPQRSLLERELLAQAARLKGKRLLLVRGLPADDAPLRQEGAVTIVSYLEASVLGPLLAACGLVVCRSGYSTIMDLARLEKNAVLIPTPGQTEQEYLASWLGEAGYCCWKPQAGLDLIPALAEASAYPGLRGLFRPCDDLLGGAVEALLERARRVSC